MNENYREHERSKEDETDYEGDDEAGEERSEKVDSAEPKPSDIKLMKKHIRTEGSRRVLFAIVGLVVLAVIAAAGYFLIPKAEALIVLRTHDVDQEMEIIVDNSATATPAGLVLMGKMLEVEKETAKNFNSTGKKNVGEKAKGTVTISNNGYSYQNPVKIAKGTKILADGKAFILQTDATLPVAKATAVIENNLPVLKTIPGAVDAEVLADEAGDSYNFGIKTFSVASYDKNKLYAQNKAAFTGGTNKEVKVLLEEDLTNAEKSMRTEALESAKKELFDKSQSEGLRILDDQASLEVISQDAGKKVGDEADSFDFTIKIKAFVIGFKEDDIRKTVTDGIQSKIKSDEMIVNPEGSKITYKIKDSNIDELKMTLTAQFKGQIGKKLSADDLKSNLKNKGLSAASGYLLSIDGVDSANIKISPSFWKAMPFSSGKIDIKFDYKK